MEPQPYRVAVWGEDLLQDPELLRRVRTALEAVRPRAIHLEPLRAEVPLDRYDAVAVSRQVARCLLDGFIFLGEVAKLLETLAETERTGGDPAKGLPGPAGRAA
jgi:hypothetical protein